MHDMDVNTLRVVSYFFYVALAILLAITVWKLIYLFWRFPGCRKCPACGDWLDGDRFRYKGVIVWTCRGCHQTYETLRNEDPS